MNTTKAPSGQLRADFDAMQEKKAPAWLRELRKAAFDRFVSLGFPSRKEEAWRNLNFAGMKRTEFRWSPQEGKAAIAHPDPVLVTPLEDLLSGDDPFQTAELGEHATNPFLALNAAFMGHGAVIRVPAGSQIVEPIHCVFPGGTGPSPTVSHPRVIVEIGAGASVTLIEEYTPGSGVAWTNSVFEVTVGENASVHHHRIQCEADDAYHIGLSAARVERNGRYTHTSIALGGALARLDLRVALVGEGAECRLNGLYAPAGTQTVDHHTHIDHLAEHTSSRQEYRGILADSARGVFNGQIFIHEGAQKTVAEQSNQNLLLSTRALVHTNPQLRIFADDVKCKHGATVGQIDREKLFYLRARGLDEGRAREMLVRAFASETLARIDSEDLRNRLEGLLSTRFFDRE